MKIYYILVPPHPAPDMIIKIIIMNHYQGYNQTQDGKKCPTYRRRILQSLQECKDFPLLNILTKRAIPAMTKQATIQKANASIKHSILNILYHSKPNKSKIN